jgi:hypothetical protein
VKDLNFVHPSSIALVASSSRRPNFVIPSAARDLHLLPSGRYPGLPFNPKTKGAERILGPFILPSREGKTLKICSYSKKCAIFFPVSSV